jgi:tRNA (guanine37-N1)-methyltransferase
VTQEKGVSHPRFDVVTLFPEMFGVVTESGVSSRALQQGLWSFGAWNPRDFATDNYKTVDDRPYGGGPGMVMMAQPLALAIAAAKAQGTGSAKVVLLSPQGRRIDQAYVEQCAISRHMVLVCGRYEAVDQRLVDALVDEEASLGDFVLSGGEIAAMALIDAVVRRLPGALNDPQSAAQDSFADESTGGLLDCPHYTRPDVWNEVAVPAALLSGHHAQIARWRREQSLAATLQKRPDLIEAARRRKALSAADEKFLGGLQLKQQN